MLAPSHKDQPHVLVKPIHLYFGFIVGFCVIDKYFPLPIGNSWVLLVLGLFGFVMSIGMIRAAIRQFRNHDTPENPHQPTRIIVETGIYRYTRNPMYVGLTLLAISVSLLMNSVWGLLGIPFILFIMRYGVIKQEELYLEGKFGAIYSNYKDSVRRWF